jgi:PilZ domain
MISVVAKEIREHERKRLSWNAKLHQDGYIWKCKAVDISPGGVKIQTDERLAINSRVLLTIGRVGSFPGEVRWQDENFAGIRFLEDAGVVEERLRDASHTRD